MHAFEGVLVGEALVGVGPEIAHIDLVIGPRGSTVEQAFVNALASPTVGHTPLLAVLEPNLPAKPHTLMVNKVTIKGAGQALLIFGPAQAALSKAVTDIERAAAKEPKTAAILAKRDSAKHPFA